MGILDFMLFGVALVVILWSITKIGENVIKMRKDGKELDHACAKHWEKGCEECKKETIIKNK